MPCYHPLQAYLPHGGSDSKKIIFDEYADHGAAIRLPCGQCIGCRLEYSRQWAIRCVHEAKLYKHNCFITLTFDDKHLPEDKSLDVKVFQDFMKRFREKVKTKAFIDKYGFYCKKLRFFHCGEYGEKRGRPHYHACIFNFDFPDRKYHSKRKGIKLYTSQILEELWPYGFSSVGDVTFESAAYVARYVVKKINGKKADEVGDNGFRHYEHLDENTGEVLVKKKEYTTMSRRPGIGSDFCKEKLSDYYPSDTIICRGREMRPPKFYDHIYEQDNLESMEIIKQRRIDKMSALCNDNTIERLEVREKVEQAKLAFYGKRELG
nr:MAG: replication initiator protein [Microviridae sp.]